MSDANFMQVSRQVSCGHCDEQFADGLKQQEKLGIKCVCVCHDREKLLEKFEFWLYELDEREILNGRENILNFVNDLIKEAYEKRTMDILIEVEAAKDAKEARHIIKDFLK